MIPAERSHLLVAAISHPGLAGKDNEDRYGISAFHLDGQGTRQALLAVVADGIGGHRAGEVAAEAAVETISQVVAAGDAERPTETMREAIIRAGQVIRQMAETDPNWKGMGSTCACVWVIDDRLYTASAGDSRIYLIRNGKIRQLTTDHTWVQEAIDSGRLTLALAREHPNAHVIRRYLGSRQNVVPDMRLHLHAGESDVNAEANQGTRLHPQDRLLLCSDGLTDLVGDEEILAAFNSGPTEAALGGLVKLANQRGGHDNITIISIQVPPETRRALSLRSWGWLSRWGVGCLAIASLLATGVLLFGGLIWYLNRPTPTPPGTTSLPALQSTLLPPFTPAPDFPSPTPLPSVMTAIPALGSSTPVFDTQSRVTNTPGAIQDKTLTPWPTNTPALPGF